MLPIESDSMNRATLVPASTVVRMNSASNMIAKWYQNAFNPTPPTTSLSTSDMPNASVGAPPVREMIDASPTSEAAWVKESGVTAGLDSPNPFT